MSIEKRNLITRQMLRDEPETLFVFGDNMEQRGFGGQAKEMRGEPNAVGIPTKWKPDMSPNAFFDDSDACFDAAKDRIRTAFIRLRSHQLAGGKIIWPEAGIGTGLANLEKSSLKIWALIELCRIKLETGERHE